MTFAKKSAPAPASAAKNEESKFNMCPFVGSIVCIGFTLPMFLIFLLSYLDLADYEEALCNVTTVEYPTTMPDSENSGLWRECDCGKYCTSRYPCIKLYTSLNNKSIIKNSYSDKDDICTISENECSNGEDPVVIYKTLESYIEKAERYINSSIPCYVHKTNPEENDIFLKKIDYTVGLTIFSVLLGITFMVFSKMSIKYLMNEHNKNKKEEIDVEMKELPYIVPLPY